MTRGTRRHAPAELDRLVPLLAAGAAAGLVLAGTGPHGCGISNDAVGYVETARHLLAGRGAVTWDGSPLVAQPPLWPLLLALAGLLSGRDPLMVAPFLQAGLLALATGVAALLYRRHAPGRPLAATVAAAGTAIAFPLVRVSLWAWSEPLFLLLLVLFVRLVENPAGEKPRWIPAGVAAAAACLARYVGIVLPATGALLLLAEREVPRRRRFARAAGFLALSLLPLAAWLARNVLVAGTPAGERGPSWYPLWYNVARVVGVVGRWCLPVPGRHLPDAGRWWWLPAAVVAAFLGRALAARLARPDARAPSPPLPSVAPAALVAGGYLGFLVVAATRTGFDVLDDRLLAPAFVPLAILAVRVVAQLPVPRGNPAPWRAAALLAAGLWLGLGATRTAELLHRAREEGLGYASVAWRESPTVRFLAREFASPSGRCRRVESNAARALVFLAGIPARLSPRHTHYHSTAVVHTPGELAGRWPGEPGTCLAWLDRERRDDLFSPRELARIARLTVLRRMADGTVWTAAPRPPGDRLPPEGSGPPGSR